MTSDIPGKEVRPLLANRLEEASDVNVIAPASGISRLDWLANAEDDARADAAERAAAVAAAIPAETVEPATGDTDPAQAISDALRTFDADEIIVVSRPEDDASWLESGAVQSARERFVQPVTHIVVHS